MPKILNYDENFGGPLNGPTGFRNWALIHAIVEYEAEHGVKLCGPGNSCGPDKDRNITVCFTVNGVELDPISILDGIEKQMEGMIEREAKKLFDQKWGNVDASVNELIDELRIVKRKCLEKFGLHDENDNEYDD